MEDVEDYDYEEQVEAIVPHVARWHWSFLTAHTLAFVSNIFSAAQTYFEALATDVGAHANYQIQRDEFQAEAGRELETILKGDGGG